MGSPEERLVAYVKPWPTDEGNKANRSGGFTANQRIPTWGDAVPQGVFGSLGGYFWLSQLSTAIGIKYAGSKDATKHPTMHRTPPTLPTTNNYTAQDGTGAEDENPAVDKELLDLLAGITNRSQHSFPENNHWPGGVLLIRVSGSSCQSHKGSAVSCLEYWQLTITCPGKQDSVLRPVFFYLCAFLYQTS